MFYLEIFLLAFILTAISTLGVRKIALYFKIVDQPDSGGDASLSRKIHSQATPLLGGLAIFLVYFFLLFIFSSHFLSGKLQLAQLLGFFGGALVLMIGGFLDDRYNLRPRQQIVFPLLAILTVILGGVEIEKITNPFGGLILLHNFIFIGPALIVIWLLGMMYTTKLLDGVDGLVSGVSAIGGLTIFLFTLTTKYYQPNIAFAALLLTAVCLGFLIFNFNPAKIFLGEGGSLLLGYILGVLAIISGGKIAIALLVMGIPILDVAWTILRRLLKGKNPFRFSDRQHLHHRLLDLGLSQKQTVLVFYALSLIFGLSGLFLQSLGKFWALLILLILMLAIVMAFGYFDRRKKMLPKTGTPPASSRPRLLLQICCAPCGTYITRDRLQSRFEVTWYFCNPNLNSFEEYNKRLAAVKAMAEKFAVPLIIEPYFHAAWLEIVKGKENEAEGGARCQLCYRDRLEKTARLAREKNFAFFGTTLLVSPYKNAAAIRKIGRELAATTGVKFLDDDFQADDGYRRSQELAKELGIYRQKFCGCEYSLKAPL